jgi:hypothetical protein
MVSNESKTNLNAKKSNTSKIVLNQKINNSNEEQSNEKIELEKTALINLIELVSCFILIFTIYSRLNILTSPFFLSQTSVHLKNIFGSYIITEDLNTPLGTIDLFNNFTKKLGLLNKETDNIAFNTLKNNPNYFILKNPNIQAKFYEKKISKLPLPFEKINIHKSKLGKFNVKNRTKNENDTFYSQIREKCEIEEKTPNKRSYLKDFFEKGIKHILNDYMVRVDCNDVIGENSIDCDGYQLNITDKKQIDCLLNIFQMKSIKFNLNLYNKVLKQIISVKFINIFFSSNGNNFLIEIKVMDIDRMVFSFKRDEFFKINWNMICAIIILILLSVNTTILIVKLFRNTLVLSFSDAIDIFLIFLLIYLGLTEIQIRLLFKYKLKNLFNRASLEFVSLHELVYYFKKSELLVGLIYASGCFKALTKCSFTEIITHMKITFSRCYMDLIGFFVVCICLVISYTLELHFLLGDTFKEFSTFTKSFAALFKLIWGEINFLEIKEHDTKAFYILMSYVIFMITIMFNLMLAIILGTYDSVKKDPTCKDSFIRLKQYPFIIKKFLRKSKFFRFLNLTENSPKFCMQDFEKNLCQYGFKQNQIDALFENFNLRKIDQIDETRIEQLVKFIVEKEFNDRPRLRINDNNLVDDYVVDTEWKKLYGKYELMENFCTVLEKRLDVIFDAVSLIENEESEQIKICKNFKDTGLKRI